jgi:thioesterase domain-containing protein
LREVFDLQTAKVSAEATSGPSLREIRGNQSSHIDALLRYRPRPYRGRLFSMVAEEILNQRKDDTLGWGRHVKGEIHVHRGTGSHESFIRDHIETVGALIRTWLEKVESEENEPA